MTIAVTIKNDAAANYNRVVRVETLDPKTKAVSAWRNLEGQESTTVYVHSGAELRVSEFDPVPPALMAG